MPTSEAQRRRPIQLAEDREAWERQPGESSKAFAAFLVYLELGPDRTLNQAARNVSEGRASEAYGGIRRWHERFRWVDRVEAHDRDVARRRRQTHLRELDEMGTKHVQQSILMQQVGLRKMQGYIKTFQAAMKKAEDLRMELMALEVPAGDVELRIAQFLEETVPIHARDALALVQQGMALERQARGLPDQTVELTDRRVALIEDPDLLAEADEAAAKVERHLRAVPD